MSSDQGSSSSSSSSSSSQPSSLSRLLSTIREARSRFTANRPPRTFNPVHPSPPAVSHDLPPPEDITSRLATDLGLDFKHARKVSQIYVDKAVELQFLSQKRATATNKKIVRSARSFKNRTDIPHLQTMVRESQKRFFKRDIRSLLTRTVDLAKAHFPSRSTAPDDSDDDDEDDDAPSPNSELLAELSDYDDAYDDDEDGPVDAEDEKALRDMSALSSCILTKMYEKGYKFPKRHEKIKLAEATGLTYRQIGIWYSNRRERNRPDRPRRKKRSSPLSQGSSDEASSPRSAEATSPRPSSPMDLVNLSGSSSNGSPMYYEDEDDDLVPTEVEDELDSPEMRDGSRVTSYSTIVSNMDSMVSQDFSPDQWAPMFASSPIDVPVGSPSNPQTFDFSVPTETVAEPSSSGAPLSVEFSDISFIQQPHTATTSRSADFYAGYLAGQAAQASSSTLPPQPAPGPSQPTWQTSSPNSSDDYQASPPLQPSRRLGTKRQFSPYPPQDHDGDTEEEDRPAKRRRDSPPTRSSGRSKSRNYGLQQRRLVPVAQPQPQTQTIEPSASAGQSSPTLRGPPPIPIAPRPTPTAQHPLVDRNSRNLKRAVSAYDLAQPSSSTTLSPPSPRNIRPMPNHSTRPRPPQNPPLTATRSQPAMSMQ